jgi:hypothetical protein
VAQSLGIKRKALFDIKIPSALERLGEDYSGSLFISDIDKTYLATQIDTLGGLIRAAFETAERKANVPGFSIVLRALRRGAEQEAQVNPLVFLSASPPQLEQKLLSKMALDGVECDGIIFKNQLAHVRNADFKKLREHVAYKLYALLQLRDFLPKKSKWVLFGDDSESDAFVFSLFTEIMAGHVSGLELTELLRFLGVHRDEATELGWICRKYKNPTYPVEAIFINLDTGSQPGYYRSLSPLIYPTENSMQLGFCLFEMKLIREQAIVSIAKDLVLRHDYKPKELFDSIVFASQRGLFSAQTANYLSRILFEKELLAKAAHLPEETTTDLNSTTPFQSSTEKPSLAMLKKKYSDEGRY